ncbi:MAG: FG-GAP repeat domain-containing protein, partial [Flavobacteriales bacterium]
NGLKDLIIGDVTANQMTALLIEETTSGVDSAVAVNDSFPSNSYGNVIAHFVTFLSGYYEDINNDGVKDLLVASNAISDASDKSSIWLYLNTGLTDQPYFELYSKNFLQSEMIDMGTSAFPTAADIDQDGLSDIILSSRKSFDNFTASTSQLWYLHNHGTAEIPAFEIIDTNWLNLPQYGLEGVYPSFGDLDADGDEDLLLGLLNGEIHAVINSAGINNPMQFLQPPFTLMDNEGNVLDAGQTATPVLYDIDENGTLDIISGNLNGTLAYFKNIGSNALPSYDRITDTLGLVIATSLLGIQGRSVPVFMGGTGIERRLIIGSETGQINEYAYVPGAGEQP